MSLINYEKPFFHGSYEKVEYPDLQHSRIDIDFGTGFYLTQDKDMARKWACNKSTSILNMYKLDIGDLNIKVLEPDIEWLNYVVSCRKMDKSFCPFDDSMYDIIIGPTADDKMFIVLDLYIDGLINEQKALEVVNCMKYSEQVVLKSEKAIHSTKFIDSKLIIGLEKEQFKEQSRLDSIKASELTRSLLRK